MYRVLLFAALSLNLIARPSKHDPATETPEANVLHTNPDNTQIIEINGEVINLEAPWLTGPLLSPSAHTIPKGHINFEPYFYSNNVGGFQLGHWNRQGVNISDSRHSVAFQAFTQFGLTPWMDFTFLPTFSFTWDGDVDTWRFGDLLLGVSFQLVDENINTSMPSIRFGINEVFPTGTYQHLSLENVGVDASGGGSYSTNFFIVFARLFHIYKKHFFSARISPGVILFTPVHVHGLNVYGGDPTTSGRVKPGTAQVTVAGFEYSLTQHWALAMDILSTYTSKTRFHGKTILQVGSKASYSLSLSPAIEYNFSQSVGMVAGIWFPVYKINVQKFLNGIFAINFYM